jgi:iron complex outermembrane receptor protein
MRNKTLLLAASVLAGMLTSAGGAFAQDTDSNTLEEIVVTAQKREERLQDVPISITAVSGQEIARRGSTGVMDLQFTVPGLSVNEYGAGQERVQLRGISNTLGVATVGKYLDEMPINTEVQQSSIDIRFLDMERIEVLRGPQGTLYGEGSMGGTIRYITKNPDLTKFGAEVEGEVSSVTDGEMGWRANAVVNLPLIEDRVGLRVVAGYEKQGGWIDSAVTGQDDVNGTEFKTVRGKLLAKVGDSGEFTLMVLHQEWEQDYQNFAFDRVTYQTTPEFNNGKQDVVNGVVRLDLGWADLVNSAGYAKMNNVVAYDISSFYVPALIGLFGFPVGFIDTVALQGEQDFEVFTDEVRLTSKPGGPFDWTVGLYGRDATQTSVSTTPTSPNTAPFTILEANLNYKSRGWSAFGEIGWHATDKLTLSAGARWFSDTRKFLSDTTSFGFRAVDKESETFTSLNPRFNAKYEFSDTSMLYANAAKGFRSGGFNTQSAGGGVFTIPPAYDPETLWSYEIGTKQQWLDRRVIFEGSVYYNDWKDVQASAFAPGSAITITTNGGHVKGWGVDLSLLARPVTGLTLSATYGWNNLEYKTTTPEKQAGDPVDWAVRESFSASIDYRRTLFGDVKGFGRVDYQHAGKAQLTLRNFGGQIIPIEERNLVNARLGLDFGQFEASIFADNLFDDDALVITGPFGVFTQNLEQRPRTVGVNVKAHF